MTANSHRFEFQISVDGTCRRYFVGPVYSSDGSLQQLSIRNNEFDAADATGGQIIGIDIDPNIFKQFAMPNQETLSRIAIAQAENEYLFASATRHAGHMLDFTVEPWEGQLIPVN